MPAFHYRGLGGSAFDSFALVHPSPSESIRGFVNFSTSHVTASVIIAPISVYHGQKISGPIHRAQKSFVGGQLGKNSISAMQISAVSIPITTGAPRLVSPESDEPAFFQNTASSNPPSKAPPVSPRRENARFKTNAALRLKDATNTSATAQNTVEPLLKRK
jgi:hypothetical protein